MPRNDGTGPLGQGSMTGRGLGNCKDVKNISNNNQDTFLGRGMRKIANALGRGLAQRHRNGQRNSK